LPCNCLVTERPITMKTKKKLTVTFIKGIDTPEKRVEIYDSFVTGLIVRVTKKGYKSFAYRYWYDGESKQLTIGKFGDVKLAEAREKVREFKRMVNEGKDPFREKKKRKEESPKTFKEAIEEYKKKYLPTLKKSTQTDYKYRIKHLLKGEGAREAKSRGFDGDRYIKDMKRFEIIEYLEGIAKNAPTQAQRIQALLSGIFKFSKNRQWVDENIANKIRLKSRKKSKSTRQNVNLNNEQIEILWSAFDGHAEPVSSMFKILLLLGQRAGETRLMKWKYIDLKQQQWIIPSSDTKNGIKHYVPLNEMALDVIKTLKPWMSGKYVFESPVNKGKPIGSQQKAAQRIRTKTNVKDFNIHSLRTTVATRIAELGTSPQVLSKILNHKKPGEGSMITAIYNKYDYEKEKRAALNRWNDYLESIITGKHKKILKLNA